MTPGSYSPEQCKLKKLFISITRKIIFIFQFNQHDSEIQGNSKAFSLKCFNNLIIVNVMEIFLTGCCRNCMEKFYIKFIVKKLLINLNFYWVCDEWVYRKFFNRNFGDKENQKFLLKFVDFHQRFLGVSNSNLVFEKLRELLRIFVKLRKFSLVFVNFRKCSVYFVANWKFPQLPMMSLILQSWNSIIKIRHVET